MNEFHELALERLSAFRYAQLGELPRPLTPVAISRLAEALVVAATDKEFLDRTALISYRHVAGFDKIVLWQGESFAKLTLHLWWNSNNAPVIAVPHTHRFSFLSVLLVGGIEYATFCSREAGTRRLEVDYTPHGDTATFLHQKRNVYLQVDKHVRISAPSAYYLRFQVPHLILRTTSPAISLVLRGPREQKTATVFPSSFADLPASVPLYPIPPDKLSEKLRVVGTLLYE